jgi:hypothetical protein
MARFAAVRSRDEVKQANYLRLISECQEKSWKISTHAGNNGHYWLPCGTRRPA